eukprot:gb/GECH01007055.1/.p1 GENE.gb/GECH01007055.1/~~gb/GECH01007055.1/.p1  ORF type:complete len:251 (+),score=34.88 gb/GECH01007055.1/:1-753(+)
MFPFSALILVLLLGISIAFFIYVIIRVNHLSVNQNFNEQFRFLFNRFRRRYFYWEIIITLRKLSLSLVSLFLSGYIMLIMIFNNIVIFASLALHLGFVPYKRKFHNMLEYIMLLSTQVVLMLTLLIFFDNWPEPKAPFNYTVTALLIARVVITSLLIIGLIILDVRALRKKDRKRIQQHKTLTLEEEDEFAQYETKIDDSSLTRKERLKNLLFDDQREEYDNINDIMKVMFSRASNKTKKAYRESLKLIK